MAAAARSAGQRGPAQGGGGGRHRRRGHCRQRLALGRAKQGQCCGSATGGKREAWVCFSAKPAATRAPQTFTYDVDTVGSYNFQVSTKRLAFPPLPLSFARAHMGEEVVKQCGQQPKVTTAEQPQNCRGTSSVLWGRRAAPVCRPTLPCMRVPRQLFDTPCNAPPPQQCLQFEQAQKNLQSNLGGVISSEPSRVFGEGSGGTGAASADCPVAGGSALANARRAAARRDAALQGVRGCNCCAAAAAEALRFSRRLPGRAATPPQKHCSSCLLCTCLPRLFNFSYSGPTPDLPCAVWGPPPQSATATHSTSARPASSLGCPPATVSHPCLAGLPPGLSCAALT